MTDMAPATGAALVTGAATARGPAAAVKTHLMRACAKLGVTGRTAAVTKAMETGAPPRVTDWH